MPATRSTVAHVTAVAAVALGLAVAAPGGAQAKEKVVLDVRGYSVPSAPAAGVYTFSGLVTGEPFHGQPFTGTFGPDDGTLPVRVPGQPQPCEAASGTMRIGNATGSVTLAVSGEMCEQWGSFPTFGEWSVTDADGTFAKAKGSGSFSWNAQLWGTLWSASGELKH
jgi:hypothetical protein